MGIKIVSILAKNPAKLASASGMKHQRFFGFNVPLQQHSQNVKEVIFQWSGGHNYRPPTWEGLLDVIQEIGHKRLSDQIEDFMKGK